MPRSTVRDEALQAKLIDEAESTLPNGEGAKALGAFYTDSQVADFLVWWGIRSPDDTVMDPCFGGGVFLRSACKRLLQLGGDPATQVSGVEIDPDVQRQITEKLSDEFGVRKSHILLGDFFDTDETRTDPVDVIVGNPPFIRYQRFSGAGRQRALSRAARAGVRLTRLSSSWAPFLVHSATMVKPGGRLAMVIPFELGHAAYARPVLDYLRKSFGKLTLLTFRKKLFADLSQGTLLLLAEGRGAHCTSFLLRDLHHAGLLSDIRCTGKLPLPGTRRIDAPQLAHGRERLIEYLIPRTARELYRELTEHDSTRRLGELADVGIGYVTGANDFFHLSPNVVDAWEIPRRFLKPAVRRGRALTGLRFTRADWRNRVRTGDASYLLSIPGEQDLPRGVQRYLAQGKAAGVHRAYKCRVRSPWFRVPHVYLPDAFLSYMSGHAPSLVANEANAVAPNSLHILRIHPHVHLQAHSLAALWQTSLTRLSTEVEGHALGGGMLKMEPTEAENVVMMSVEDGEANIEALAEELDSLSRGSNEGAAQLVADEELLRRQLGLTGRECRLLREAAETLHQRRYA